MNYKEIYRKVINDKTYQLQFGKHKGLTIGFLMDAEPQYLLWLIAQEIIRLDFHLQNEFEQMNPWVYGEQTAGVEPNSGEAWE